MTFEPNPDWGIPRSKDPKDAPREEAMRVSFIKVAGKLLEEEEFYGHDEPSYIVGFEHEYPILDRELKLSPENVKKQVLAAIPHSTIELAAHQVETTSSRLSDIRDSGWLSIYGDLAITEQVVVHEVQKSGSHILRIGIVPHVKISSVKPSHGYQKYIRSPNWHRDNQRPGLDTSVGHLEKVDCSNPYVVGLCNSVQVTLDADSFPDAIDKLNRLSMISPMAVALAGNSQFLECQDTGLSDVRFLAWATSHDSRSEEEVLAGRKPRIGLPDDYYVDMRDYFSRILEWPFVLNHEDNIPHAFGVGQGLFWREARLKWFHDKGRVGVEFRPISLQPTLEEDLGVMAFVIGRLIWSQRGKEKILPIEVVHANRQAAEKSGLRSVLHFRQEDGSIAASHSAGALDLEIDRATAGLTSIGCQAQCVEDLLGPIRERVRTQQNPSDKLVRAAVDNRFGESTNWGERRDALVRALSQCNLLDPKPK